MSLRTDAAIYYNRNNFRVGLNFRNIFDVECFTNSVNRHGVDPGEPFTVVGSVSVGSSPQAFVVLKHLKASPVSP
ncbi:MAG: hypothetical protein AAGA67_00045 [Cyanobacteria bacterium P01_F01_bin.153]